MGSSYSVSPCRTVGSQRSWIPPCPPPPLPPPPVLRHSEPTRVGGGCKRVWHGCICSRFLSWPIAEAHHHQLAALVLHQPMLAPLLTSIPCMIIICAAKCPPWKTCSPSKQGSCGVGQAHMQVQHLSLNEYKAAMLSAGGSNGRLWQTPMAGATCTSPASQLRRPCIGNCSSPSS